MSKKITSFLALVVMLLVSTSASAQLAELQGKSVSVGGAVADFEPDTWYFLHQQRIVNDNKVEHSEVGELPLGAGFIHDEGVGNVIYHRSIDNVPEGSSAITVAGYLVRFVPSDEHEGAYFMQFGTGNYLNIPEGAQNRTQMPTVASIYDATELDVYKIQDTDGHFAMNQYPMGVAINCTGVNYPVPVWGSGLNTTIDGNADYSFHEVLFDALDERTEAQRELEAVVTEYREYFSSLTVGTNPGEYGEAEVEAFDAALRAGDVDNPDAGIDKMTAEEIRQLIQNIRDAYEAVLASRVPMTLADGYYRLKTGQRYVTTILDEETYEETEEEVDKYMYSNVSGERIYANWGSRDDLSIDAPSLWKVTNLESGRFDIVNVATGTRFNQVTKSSHVAMSEEGGGEIVVTPAITIEGVTYVNISVYPQNGNDGLFFHQGGHQSGLGTGGNVVGWYSTYDSSEPAAHGSEWLFISVSDEEAAAIIEAYKPYQDRDAMLNDYKAILADAKAKLVIARDIQKNVDDQPLITDAEQLSSPCSDSQEGLNIEYLIDGDASTFWHSDWHNEYDGMHYLQVEIADADVQNAVMQFTRRNNTGNQILDWAVYGTENFDATQEECDHLADLNTPLGSYTETLVSDVFPTRGHKYIRFYFVRTTGSKTPVFAHLAEFQMFRAEVFQSETCQYNVMGDLATNLEKVINDQADYELDDITVEEYTALKTAYDAFIAKFVDPTPLREAMAATADIAALVVEGSDPGFWPSGDNANNLQSLYNEAKAYDAAGNYTAEQSQQYIDRLNQEKENVYANANPVKVGKWYRLRFPSEEDYDKYGWSKSGASTTSNSEGQVTAWELFGKYLIPADYSAEDKEVDVIGADELALGSHLYFAESLVINNPELQHFRFIAVGDSAYMMQNRATGLFLKAAGTSGGVTLSVHPSLFSTRAIGYGLNVIASRSITGANQNYLHAQRDNNTLVTWNAYTLGSNSALYIEEAEDVAANYDGADFQMSLPYGTYTGLCFPMDISVGSNSEVKLWGVNKVENNVITLGRIAGAVQGGRPFILQFGDTEKYDAEGDKEMVTLRHGFAVTGLEPQTTALLKGSYESKVVGAGVIVPEANTLAVSKRSNTRVAANGAYIAAEEAFDLETVFEIAYSETDGIQTALANVSRRGAVYTIDGRLVSRNATLSDLSRFGKGIYLLNGTKVVVK